MAAEGRASWPLGGRASAKAGPKSSESEGNCVTCPRARKKIIMREFKQWIRAHARVREGEKRRGLSAHSPSPRAQHPNPRSWTHEMPRRPLGHDGEKWMTPFLKPRAEGYETEIFTKCTFWDSINRVACIRKPQTIYTLTVWVITSDWQVDSSDWQRRYSMALHRKENKVPL